LAQASKIHHRLGSDLPKSGLTYSHPYSQAHEALHLQLVTPNGNIVKKLCFFKAGVDDHRVIGMMTQMNFHSVQTI